MSAAVKDPRFPIGKYEPQPYSEKQFNEWLNDIKFLPSIIESAVQDLDEHQYDTPYREGGWTIKQLVHHVADSHMNAYIRFRLGLTEDSPAIKPYRQDEWAKLNDSRVLPANVSVTLLHAVHSRLYETLKNITPEQWERTVFHPEHEKQLTLWFLLGMYVWHGRHHTAHITVARENYGWN